MGWREHLQEVGAKITVPWTGGRTLRSWRTSYTIDGALPPEFGWYTFGVWGRKAANPVACAPLCNLLRDGVSGYLVGDRLVPDSTTARVNLKTLATDYERVYLLEPGLDRFACILAGRMAEDAPLIFHSPAMPSGPEAEVLQAFLDRAPTLDRIKGVTPGLEAAFRLECWERYEDERRRAELEKQRREEEARRAREEQRRELAEKLGDGAGRRAMAAVDFAAAARAALSLSGAELLEEHKGYGRGERVVRYRLDGLRLECVCDERTLQIYSSGICLTDDATGVSGDTRFTLESLPGVVREAERRHRLVIRRHF
jgi:hypothetical protein